jgi:hypothetical protein
VDTAVVSPTAGHVTAFGAVLVMTVAWLSGALRVPARAMAVLMAWQALLGGLALAGYFTRFDQPWRALPTVGLSVLAAVWLASQPWPTAVGRWLAASRPWAWAALHTFRLPLEGVLYNLFLYGVIGRQMTFAGSNFVSVPGTHLSSCR